MPRTIPYRPVLIDELITTSRIYSYENVFTYRDDAELVGAYLWNANACAGLYPLVQMVEVSLRNAIDSALSSNNNRLWWARGRLRYASFQPGTSEPVKIRNIRSHFEGAANKVRQDKQERYGSRTYPTHAEIVAKTDFVMWEWMLDPEFYGNSLFWPGHLNAVFRGDWQGRTDLEQLTHARDQIRSIRKFRNRLFHHEPAWKKFGVNGAHDAVNHLQERVGQLSDFLSLMHPDLQALAVKSHLISLAQIACSAGELRRFQYQVREHTIGSKRGLKELVRKCALAQEVAVARARGNCPGFLIVPL
ncbi:MULTISPECIES: CAAX protease [Xanthomonas]|uniref:CAAX protease n=1 Tax=Xanthomonas TaxID=338 RepID=UPI000ADD7F13|nr:CAAX protease [Xanthomonas campestris]MCC5043748.1 hypothetical protein [Xanthomonas campestris]